MLHVPHGAADGEAAARLRMMAALARLTAAGSSIEGSPLELSPSRWHFRSVHRHGRVRTHTSVIFPSGTHRACFIRPPSTGACPRSVVAAARTSRALHRRVPQQHAPRPSDAARRLSMNCTTRPFHFWPRSICTAWWFDRAAGWRWSNALAAGVAEDHLHTRPGPGAGAIDPTGQNTGGWRGFLAALESHRRTRVARAPATEIERSVGAWSPLRAEGRRVLTEFRKHGGHLISYFSVGSVERLSPAKPWSASRVRIIVPHDHEPRLRHPQSPGASAVPAGAPLAHVSVRVAFTRADAATAETPTRR